MIGEMQMHTVFVTLAGNHDAVEYRNGLEASEGGLRFLFAIAHLPSEEKKYFEQINFVRPMEFSLKVYDIINFNPSKLSMGIAEKFKVPARNTRPMVYVVNKTKIKFVRKKLKLPRCALAWFNEQRAPVLAALFLIQFH